MMTKVFSFKKISILSKSILTTSAYSKLDDEHLFQFLTLLQISGASKMAMDIK